MLSLLFLIPLLPLVGALFNGLIGRRFRSERAVGLIACGAVLLAFVISAGAVIQLATGLEGYADSAPPFAGVDLEARSVELTLAPWITRGTEGSVVVDWAFTLDPLSSVLILVVTGVGFLIHVYSMGYMHSDPGYARYFSYLNLFMGMMLILVLGSSLLVMFVGWEGVELFSSINVRGIPDVFKTWWKRVKYLRCWFSANIDDREELDMNSCGGKDALSIPCRGSIAIRK